MSLNSKTYVDSFIESVDLVEETSELATTVQKTKDWARIDGTFDDSIVETLIKDAQKAFRRYTRSVLYETTVTVVYSFDRRGNVEFRLPYGPVDSITSVKSDGEAIDYENNDDWVSIDSHNADDVEVVYTAKRYDADDDVDADIEVGIWKYVATNDDDRENTAFEEISEVPDGSKQKWSAYRRMQL